MKNDLIYRNPLLEKRFVIAGFNVIFSNEIENAPAINAIKFPCHAGDLVWHVKYDDFGDGCVIEDAFIAANDEIVICTAVPYGLDGISQYLLDVYNEGICDVEVSIYEHDNCFVSREEAEAALQRSREDAAASMDLSSLQKAHT